ncbi:conserved hypothetical protein [Ricinus communis]|uniref:Uncharacterized protein n=1 Tax=Ricinus communis TaxID=3988 RepID=B9SQA6_RICCO|nr:conserved hypothetical protein [Ricinus communis]
MIVGSGDSPAESRMRGESRNVVSATKRFATPVDVVVKEVFFLVIDMRLPLPDLGKLKDYVPEMLAIENIEARRRNS